MPCTRGNRLRWSCPPAIAGVGVVARRVAQRCGGNHPVLLAVGRQRGAERQVCERLRLRVRARRRPLDCWEELRRLCRCLASQDDCEAHTQGQRRCVLNCDTSASCCQHCAPVRHETFLCCWRSMPSLGVQKCCSPVRHASARQASRQSRTTQSGRSIASVEVCASAEQHPRRVSDLPAHRA